MVEELFTLDSLLSLQGAALASWMVPNVLGYVIGDKFNKARKWVCLIIAFVLAFLVAYTSNISSIAWIVAVFNGFLIFASAVGINQVTPKGKKEHEISVSSSQQKEIAKVITKGKKLPAKTKAMFRKEIPFRRSKQPKLEISIKEKPLTAMPKRQLFSNWF